MEFSTGEVDIYKKYAAVCAEKYDQHYGIGPTSDYNIADLFMACQIQNVI